MESQSIVNTNIMDIVMQPTVVRDDSAVFGLSPVPHSGRVANAHAKAKEGETRKMNRNLMWIGIGVFALFVFTMK